jgi:two-component system NtrC family sensor kinase
MQVCRRIFGGMLAIARGAARRTGHGDLRRAVDGALAILDDGLRRRRIERKLTLPDDLPPIRGSQADLEQVLFNLMANARDAMPRGGTLELEARFHDGKVLVRVRDTGVGIPESDLPRIQEPFFSTKPQGSGLGLAICRSIVWGMGGEMSLHSREGEGTRVEIALPAADGRKAQDEV